MGHTARIDGHKTRLVHRDENVLTRKRIRCRGLSLAHDGMVDDGLVSSEREASKNDAVVDKSKL